MTALPRACEATVPELKREPANFDLSVFARPRTMKTRYFQFALISHRRHVERLGPPDPDRLVVSSDWIAWRRALKNGHAALHSEHMLLEWPNESPSPTALFVEASRWMYVDGRDPTIFDGVSLGKQFTGYMVHVARGHIRMWHGLDRLVAEFGPRNLVLHDLRADVDALTEAQVEAIVAAIANRHGATLSLHRDPAPVADGGLAELPYQRVPPPEAALRHTARDIYSCLIGIIFARRKRGPGVLLILNPAAVHRLITAYSAGTVHPVLIARQMPKTVPFLATCWRRGIVLAHLPEERLDNRDLERLNEMRVTLEDAWSEKGSNPISEACRDVFRALWDLGEVHERARLVKGWKSLISRSRPSRAVIGDAGNNTCRLAAELGSRRGIEIDECPNGMFVTPTRHDSRCGDGIRSGVLSRFLSWGAASEAWLKATATSVSSIRVGNPALAPRPPKPRRLRLERALVLPVSIDATDVSACRSNIVFHLIDVVAALTGAGIPHIRIKTHPGRVDASYYKAALTEAGWDCPIESRGGLKPHLAWADFVVGPPNSGAWVETLDAGLPYYPLRAEPSLIEPDFCGGARLYSSAAQIVEDLRQGTGANSGGLLDSLCSTDTIPDSASRFWAIMEQSE